MASLAALWPALFAVSAQDPGHALAAPWKHWRYSAAIEVPAIRDSRLVRVVVPERVSRKALPFWPDLRVVDDSGQEVPFVLHARVARGTRVQRSARLMDLTHDPGSDTRATLDLGADTDLHNGIEIETPDEEFFARVSVDVSPDRRSWRIVQESAPIYRFTSSNLTGNQTVRYPDNSSRFVRLRISNGAERFLLTSVRAWHLVEEEPELMPVDVSLHADAGAPRAESWWTADTMTTGLPVSRVRFDVDQRAFHRPVRVRASDDGKTWRLVGSGEIYRMGSGAGTRDVLHVDFPETHTRFLRVETVNRDDPPLTNARPRLLAIPRRVVFRAEPGRAYRLLFGNPRGSMPDYELARVTSTVAVETAAAADLGQEATNADYMDPAPWTERHPIVLWSSLIVALLVLGALAIRSLKSAGTFVPHSG
jgi:hypothetical protein